MVMVVGCVVGGSVCLRLTARGRRSRRSYTQHVRASAVKPSTEAGWPPTQEEYRVLEVAVVVLVVVGWWSGGRKRRRR